MTGIILGGVLAFFIWVVIGRDIFDFLCKCFGYVCIVAGFGLVGAAIGYHCTPFISDEAGGTIGAILGVIWGIRHCCGK